MGLVNARARVRRHPIPPADPKLREQLMRKHEQQLALVSPVAQEMFLASYEWSLAHGTEGRVPKWMVDPLHAAAVSRCRERGEIP